MSDKKKQKKNVAGGSAAGGGINFQTAVTAIAEIHMANGSKLGWFEGVQDDIPIEVSVETGGPGDDIKLRYPDGSVAEAQVKKGLRQGGNLWGALINLAKAINNKDITHGLLIVCPESSASIRSDLSRDIHRIGDGRTDNLKGISETFTSKLKGLNIEPETVCRHLRVITVHALEHDSANISSAHSELRHICSASEQIEHAWDCLYKDATKLIEFRGRRTVATVMQSLESSGISVAGSDSAKSPLSMLSALREWTKKANSSFEIFGINKPLSLDKAWLPLKTVVRKEDTPEQETIAEALEHYHRWEQRKYNSDEKSIEPTSIGRFIRRCVVIAGPGMGKSTLLKKLALVYAGEGFPVIKVKLSSLAARMKNGSGFEEGIFSLGLDGSSLQKGDFDKLVFKEWVLLCDGLDEAGSHQLDICEGLQKFITSNPLCRAIATTRPAGYSTNSLKGWRHYELLPMIEDKADAYTRKLLSGVCEPGSTEFDDCHNFACYELKNNKAGKVVERSPLLLGLAVSLAIRKVNFGHSKVDLFKRLFQLVDDASSSRSDKPNISKAKVNRFLDVLGWVLFKHPVSTAEFAIGKCAEILMAELELSKLNATEECEIFLRYWEEAGLVETIRHTDENTITYIHKSFGEYAAARYIVALPEDEVHAVVDSELSSAPDSEVLKYAGSLGASKLIASELIKRVKDKGEESEWIKRALVLLADSEFGPDEKDKADILDTAFALIKSPRYFQSKGIAIAMLSVSRRYPDEVAQRARNLINSEHPWIRLSAWAFVTTGGNSFYSFNDLVDAFESLPEISEPGFKSFLGGFTLKRKSFSDLRETFVANAVCEVVRRLPEDKADKVLSTLARDDLRKTVGFSMNISDLLSKFGKEELAKQVAGSQGNARVYFDAPEFNNAQNVAHRKILSALADRDNLESDHCPEAFPDGYGFIQLGAFLEASAYWNVSLPDIWGWQEEQDDEAVREVFRGIIEIDGIDKAILSQEAKVMLDRINSASGNDGHYSFYMDINHVDVDDDLEAVNYCGLDIHKLERALHHKSEWIVQLAGYLLENLDDKNALLEIVKRVIDSGRGVAFWIAAQIAQRIEMDLKMLLIERLKLPLVPGCQYLYRKLSELELELDDEVKGILRNGLLNSGPLTAEESTKVIAKLSHSEIRSLVPLMEEGYQHWLSHEEPHPKDGGRVPDSPREELLALLLTVDSVSNQNLLRYVTDERSDVQRLAETALIDRLGGNETLRGEFIESVREGEMRASLLSQALRQSVQFNETQCELIIQLLSNDDAKIRYAAMCILDLKYLPQYQIGKLAKVLSEDNELEIREKAMALVLDSAQSGNRSNHV